MNELSYSNGEIGTAEELTISVLDAGFVQGVTVSEQLRTFDGKLFQLEKHWARLQRSLQIIGIDDLQMAQLRTEAEVIASHNYSLLPPGDDLGLTVFVTPGHPFCAPDVGIPNRSVGIFTTPLPFCRWADKYATGESLVISSVHQVPANCWPPELKCRSRMHYFLADREAQLTSPGARALLLDQEGFVAEASTASVILYREEEGFVAPLPDKVLPSISVGVMKSIAQDLGIGFVHRNISIDDLGTAQEIFLNSTSPCVLPVTSVHGMQICNTKPGPVFAKVVNAWNQIVGIDIVKQATQLADRC